MIHIKKQYIVDVFGKEPETLDEVAHSVIAVANSYFKASSLKPDATGASVSGFSWNITYNNKVSNSHNSPIGGKQNWGGRNKDTNVPTSYSGFSGRVWIRYNNKDRIKTSCWGSDPLKSSLTYPGTGGYGSYNGPWENLNSAYFKKYGHKNGKEMNKPDIYSWDYRFFLSDWPLIEEWIAHRELWSQLKSNEDWRGNHQFTWHDPETAEKDDEFWNNLLEIYPEEEDNKCWNYLDYL